MTGWRWLLGGLVVGLAGGAGVVRHRDRAAAGVALAKATRQAASYDSLLAFTTRGNAIARDSIGKLRAAGDSAARATAAAKATTDAALARLAKLPRPAATDSTNPEWQRIAGQQAVVIEGQTAQITNLTTQVTKLDAAYRADSARADAWQTVAGSAKMTVDSLKAEVQVAAVGSDACRFLLWKCPSRKTTAIVGAVVASAGFVFLSKK